MMKNRLKPILLGTFLLLGVSSATRAQSVIVSGGLNLANISINQDGSAEEATMLPTFQAGVAVDFKVLPFLSLQPGLKFTGKGTKVSFGDEASGTWYRATVNPYYLELPVNGIVRFPLGGAKLFAGAGPYVAMGVAGKNKVKGELFDIGFESEDNITWSNDDPTTPDEEDAGLGRMRRFDYGLNALAGIEGGPVVFTVGYGLGLAKLQSGSNSGSDDANKHRVFSITLGYKF